MMILKDLRRIFLDKLKKTSENSHGNVSLSKVSFKQIQQMLCRSMDFLKSINDEIIREYRQRFNDELNTTSFHYNPNTQPPPSDGSVSSLPPHHDVATNNITESIASANNSTHSPVSPAEPVIEYPLVSEKNQDGNESDGSSTIITKKSKKQEKKEQKEQADKIQKKIILKNKLMNLQNQD